MNDSIPAALTLDLVEIPSDRVKGIYTIGGVPNRMPTRALYLHPTTARDFLGILSDALTVSDIFRSAESSLAAVKSGRGAKPPGFSAHNFGLAIDVDVAKGIRAHGMIGGKASFDSWLASFGFHCHRLDHKVTDIKGESHHFNHFGSHNLAWLVPGERSTAGAIERRIVELYGHTWRDIDPTVAQAQLARLGLYRGDLDGQLGPISKAAIRVFRRGWGLGDSDRLDARTFRTLVYVAAGRRVTQAVG
jgi:hypothetical protein